MKNQNKLFLSGDLNYIIFLLLIYPSLFVSSSFEKLNNHDSSQKPGVFAILIRCTNEQITFPDLDTILPMRAEDMTREAGFQQPGRRDRYDDLSTPLPMVISNHWCH